MLAPENLLIFPDTDRARLCANRQYISFLQHLAPTFQCENYEAVSFAEFLGKLLPYHAFTCITPLEKRLAIAFALRETLQTKTDIKTLPLSPISAVINELLQANLSNDELSTLREVKDYDLILKTFEHYLRYLKKRSLNDHEMLYSLLCRHIQENDFFLPRWWQKVTKIHFWWIHDFSMPRIQMLKALGEFFAKETERSRDIYIFTL